MGGRPLNSRYRQTGKRSRQILHVFNCETGVQLWTIYSALSLYECFHPLLSSLQCEISGRSCYPTLSLELRLPSVGCVFLKLAASTVLDLLATLACLLTHARTTTDDLTPSHFLNAVYLYSTFYLHQVR